MGISLYPGTGSKNGVDGDHVLLSPAYTSTEQDIVDLVDKIKETVTRVFAEIN